MMDVFERVKAILVRQLSISADRVTSNARFREDLKANEIDLEELMMAFEDEFGVEISNDTAKKFKVVGQVVNFLQILQPR